MAWTQASTFAAENVAQLAIGASALVAAAVHAPVRGSSVRDRWRGCRPEPVAGVRVTAGARGTITARDVEDIVADCPVPVDVVSIHRHRPRVGGEIAHRYRGVADQLGVAEGEWTSVLIGGGPAGASGRGGSADRLRLGFLVHRLGLLGLRSRPLDDAEFATCRTTAPDRILARAAGRRHVRRPHLWFTPSDDVLVDEAPAQLIGVGRDGRALTVRLPSMERLTVVADLERVPELLVPTLITGARVGIRTHRPGHFRSVLDHGAVLVAAAGDATIDVLVRDGDGHAVDVPAPATTPPAVITLTDEVRPDAPSLTIGPHLWHLTIGGETTSARPPSLFMPRKTRVNSDWNATPTLKRE